MSAWKPSVFGRFDQLEQLDHALPAVHAAPADFAFGREPLAVALRRRRRLRGRSRRSSSCCRPDPSPSRAGPPAESMRTTPYGRTPSSRSFLAMRQALRTCVDELLALLLARPSPSRRRSAARPARRPSRRRDLRDATLSASRFRSSSRRVDADVRIEEEQIDAVELHAVDLGRGGEVEHRVEIDRRLGVRRPCRRGRATWRCEVSGYLCMVLRYRLLSCQLIGLRSDRSSLLLILQPFIAFVALASGLPGPKCFRMTSGSVALRFSMRTPCARRPRRDEELVFRHLAEADHRRRRHRERAERAVALRQDDAVGAASLIVTVRFGSTVSSFAEYQPRAVGDPLLAVALGLGLANGFTGFGNSGCRPRRSG